MATFTFGRVILDALANEERQRLAERAQSEQERSDRVREEQGQQQIEIAKENLALTKEKTAADIESSRGQLAIALAESEMRKALYQRQGAAADSQNALNNLRLKSESFTFTPRALFGKMPNVLSSFPDDLLDTEMPQDVMRNFVSSVVGASGLERDLTDRKLAQGMIDRATNLRREFRGIAEIGADLSLPPTTWEKFKGEIGFGTGEKGWGVQQSGLTASHVDKAEELARKVEDYYVRFGSIDPIASQASDLSALIRKLEAASSDLEAKDPLFKRISTLTSMANTFDELSSLGYTKTYFSKLAAAQGGAYGKKLGENQAQGLESEGN